MYQSRFILFAVAFALILGAVVPDVEARRNCNCTLCQPGNLLAPCYWPGYGMVYCVDYWEFQCNGPAVAGATAEEAAAETLVCSAEDTEDEALPEPTDSDDVVEEPDVDLETDLADD